MEIRSCKFVSFCFSFFFLSGFFFTDTSDSQDSRRMEGTIFFPLCHFHPLTNIQTFICNFTCEMTLHTFNCTACIYQTATRWDLPPYLPPYRITIWLIDDVMIAFVCLHDDLVLDVLLQQSEMGNRWIQTRIDYHPCITSEPTNQLC